MTRVVQASCSGGEVTAEGVKVETAVILSEGEGESQGALVMDREKQFYIPNTTPDLNTTLEKLIAALNHVVTGLNAAGSALDGISGGAGVPVTAAATQITPIVTELETLKGALK